jgi:DNA-binding NarL/FixJ family response regulator
MNILIADDHPILSKGLISLLQELGYNIVSSELDGRAALSFIIKHKPEIAILDIEMPFLTGIEVARECEKLNLETKVVLLTLHKEIDFFLEAKKYNVFGYILKEFALEEIEECISSIRNNMPFFSKKVKDHFTFLEESNAILKELTPAELRILKYMAEFKTSKEIAELLFLSPRTIEKQKSSIIEKLDLPKENRVLNKWVEKNKNLFF